MEFALGAAFALVLVFAARALAQSRRLRSLATAAFGRALPSAATGGGATRGTHAARADERVDLRWAEVVNLTAAATAAPPRAHRRATDSPAEERVSAAPR